MEIFKIALIQMSMSDRPEVNSCNAVERIHEAAGHGASIVCLPELYLSRYFCQTEDIGYFNLSEPIPGPTTRELCNVAKKANVVIIAPIFERRMSGLYYNTTVVINNNGEVLGLYRKMHIPDDPGYYEKFYFTPGDLGFPVFDTGAGRIGTLTCWDQWFPEAARLIALKGASIIFYPTAIGWHTHEKEETRSRLREAWITIQRGHAIANELYVAVVNRTGIEKTEDGSSELEFWGNSFLADPFGNVIAEASGTHDEILYGEIDLARIEEVRRNWPFFRDRRIDAYGDIRQRYLSDEPWTSEG